MSKRTNKTVETKIGTGYENQSHLIYTSKSVENKPTLLKTSPSVPTSRLVSNLNDHKSQGSNLVSTSNSRPVTTVPEVKLSPLRSRLKERNSNVSIEERPHPLCEKNEKTKPKVKIMVDIKSPPKVFKSPTWYKSPRAKLVKSEDSQDVVFKQLLLKDPRYTEQDICKILNDHK